MPKGVKKAKKSKKQSKLRPRGKKICTGFPAGSCNEELRKDYSDKDNKGRCKNCWKKSREEKRGTYIENEYHMFNCTRCKKKKRWQYSEFKGSAKYEKLLYCLDCQGIDQWVYISDDSEPDAIFKIEKV